jgi:hypothetical protein
MPQDQAVILPKGGQLSSSAVAISSTHEKDKWRSKDLVVM